MPNKPYYKWIIPPEDWDKKLALSKETSLYYALLVGKMGNQLADYYWDRRYLLDLDRDHYYRDICKEISEKAETFLKSRGIYGD